jgi:hypothetical protein
MNTRTQKQMALALLLIGGCLFIFSSCKNEDPPPPGNEVELITTLTLTLTDSADANNVVVAIFSDPDGVGGNGPTLFDDLDLEAGKTYYATVLLLDESKDPAENITEEVEEEGADHQFYYLVDGADITVEYDDADENGRPIGIASIWRTGAAGEGNVTVVLKHKPGEKGDNDPVQTGDTDIEVEFHTHVN